MEFYKYIFVILVYRNFSDLQECLESIGKSVSNSRAIIVDAFYSDECSSSIKKIANSFNCEYVEIENKGYSYGNNVGIKYAKEHYSFDYLIVSNPDILVKNIKITAVDSSFCCAIGPKIYNLRGKNQNPMYFRPNLMYQKLIYKGLKHNKKSLFALGIFLNKFDKILFRALHCFKKSVKVYQLHGSFIIFTKALIDKFESLFDENMFLFAEESYLAYLLKNNNIPSYYFKSLYVIHKEDGSMKYRNDINEKLAESNIYLMEKYYNFK